MLGYIHHTLLHSDQRLHAFDVLKHRRDDQRSVMCMQAAAEGCKWPENLGCTHHTLE